MKIYCNVCGNEKDFVSRREVETEFDYKKGCWNKERVTTGERVIVCRECGEDDDIVVS